jgi:hypothetical protein
MAERAPASLIVSAAYTGLRREVEAILIKGQRAIEEAKVRTYWDSGEIMRAHLALHADEPTYGTQVMARLARDLKVSETVLYRCIRFVECFPILATRPKLSWAHYRTLIPIADPKQRHALEREAIAQDWSVAQLEDRIRPLRELDHGSNGTTVKEKVRLLTPKRGTPGLHLLVQHDDGLAVDLGFKLYHPISPEQRERFSAGEIVRVSESRITKAPDAARSELFTYRARIRRVVDGDTLIVVLRVSSNIELVEKLRLRGLDCPEHSTPEGRNAKRFTDSLLGPGAEVVLSTTKPDKYDRYLADVFVPAKAGAQEGGSKEQEYVFLNNALLEHAHAEPKHEWEFGDWGV